MPDKDRDNLIAQNDGRCALCGVPCLKTGEAAHILPQKKSGPRYVEGVSEDEIECPANKIFLCLTDHRMVDKRDSGFWSTPLLKSFKRMHESYIAYTAGRLIIAPKPYEASCKFEEARDAVDRGDIGKAIECYATAASTALSGNAVDLAVASMISLAPLIFSHTYPTGKGAAVGCIKRARGLCRHLDSKEHAQAFQYAASCN